MSKPQAEQGSMTKQVIIAGVAALEMNIVRLRYAVPVLLLGVAACGGSPAASKAAASTAPPVALHGVFIRYYGANPASDGWGSCFDAEANEGPQISAEAHGETRIADLTFANTPPSYIPPGTPGSEFGQKKVWLCAGRWSVTVPRSADGWVFTLAINGSSSSVTVLPSSSGSSITLDDGGTLSNGNGGGLEQTDPSAAQVALNAAAAKAAAAQKAAAGKAAAEKKAAAAKAAAARAAKIRAENTPISAAQWGRVIRNPDNYIGDIYTISGTVAEYNLNSNSIATVEQAALVATDANGNDFIVEANASKLGNVQPGQTFTAKVTVLGVVQVENTISGGTGEAPDFDASTFTVTG
jgi:hypothetical protein